MAERKRKVRAEGKPAVAKSPRASLATRGVEALVRSKGPGELAVQKKPAGTAGKLTTFTLNAPDAARVFVAGSFNAWDPAVAPLRKDQTGIWKTAINLEPGRHEYRFVVDGVWWDDPMNSMRSSNEFGTQNCIVIVE